MLTISHAKKLYIVWLVNLRLIGTIYITNLINNFSHFYKRFYFYMDLDSTINMWYLLAKIAIVQLGQHGTNYKYCIHLMKTVIWQTIKLVISIICMHFYMTLALLKLPGLNLLSMWTNYSQEAFWAKME